MVVSAQRLATLAGVDVLRAGGNAVDAAVAVGYALAVVYPAAGNLGGGGFMTIRLADGREEFLDFREAAPRAARADMFLGADGTARAGASTRSALAVAVPGTVAGLELARERFGTLPRAQLIAPALELARAGFLLDEGDAVLLAHAAEDLRRDPAAAAIFLKNGRDPWARGERLQQADLARTLERIAAEGAAGFYRGAVAEALASGIQADGGILTRADLQDYAPRMRAPVECDYRAYHVIAPPPPSAGGTLLCEMLNILEGYPLSEYGHGSARALHVQIEAMRYAYRDRAFALGDPDFVDNPVGRLIDKAYAARLRARIDPARASVLDAPPEGASAEGANTTHYSVVDGAGNAVAVTYTLNGNFGARIVAPGTGVLLNNEMDDFTVQRGAPNQFGLLQGAANAIAPGKRPLSSMTPTILTRAGRTVLVVGSPGGGRITTIVLQVICNLVDFGMDVQEAVDAARVHQQWQPVATSVEPGALGPDARRILEAMGHRFTESGPRGHVAAILLGAPRLDAAAGVHGALFGANDPRGGTGLAAGD